MADAAPRLLLSQAPSAALTDLLWRYQCLGFVCCGSPLEMHQPVLVLAFCSRCVGRSRVWIGRCSVAETLCCSWLSASSFTFFAPRWHGSFCRMASAHVSNSCMLLLSSAWPMYVHVDCTLAFSARGSPLWALLGSPRGERPVWRLPVVESLAHLPLQGLLQARQYLVWPNSR